MSSYLECRQRVNFADLITFTRATEETGYNAAKQLVTFPAGTPAVPVYNPATGEPLGLQVFEQRTNLQRQSENFATSAGIWVLSNFTLTANTATAPDGTLTADRLTSTANGQYRVQSLESYAAATTYTYSVFVKDSSTGSASLGVRYGAGFFRVSYVLATGSATVNDSSGYILNHGLEDVGNGWYRIHIVFNVPVLDASTNIVYFDCTTNGFSGTTGDNALFWGAQLEAGSFPTPYIKTEATTATRNASVAVINDINESEWFNSEQGSFYVKWYENSGVDNYIANVIGISNGNATALTGVFTLIQRRGNGKYNIRCMRNDGTSVNVDTAANVSAGLHTATLRYVGNDAYLSVDGSPEVTVANVRRGEDRVNIGTSATGAGQFNGHIAQLIYTPSTGV